MNSNVIGKLYLEHKKCDLYPAPGNILALYYLTFLSVILISPYFPSGKYILEHMLTIFLWKYFTFCAWLICKLGIHRIINAL